MVISHSYVKDWSKSYLPNRSPYTFTHGPPLANLEELVWHSSSQASIPGQRKADKGQLNQLNYYIIDAIPSCSSNLPPAGATDGSTACATGGLRDFAE